jgi:preprotein translocase subunit SecD
MTTAPPATAAAVYVNAVPRGILRLLVVAAVFAGCGGSSGDGGDPDPVTPRDGAQRDASTRFEALGGVRARFDVKGGDAAATVEVLRKRALEMRLDTYVYEDGERIAIESAGKTAKEARDAIAELTAPGNLRFYDWEANVIGPDGRPRPEDPNVTGGMAAGAGLAAVPRAEARKRAGPGTVMVRAEGPDVPGEQSDRWYVLRDDPALTGEEVLDPKQSFDQGPGGSGQPIVEFAFTDRGRRAFRALTREIARRGQRNHVPGGEPLEAVQHFAIVLDDEIVSVPYIDYAANPDGVDAEKGSQIEGGFTIESAQHLAAILNSGPLPAALVPHDEERVEAP